MRLKSEIKRSGDGANHPNGAKRKRDRLRAVGVPCVVRNLNLEPGRQVGTEGACSGALWNPAAGTVGRRREGPPGVQSGGRSKTRPEGEGTLRGQPEEGACR